MTTLISLESAELTGIYELLADWLQENKYLTIEGASDEDFHKLSALHAIRNELAKRKRN